MSTAASGPSERRAAVRLLTVKQPPAEPGAQPGTPRAGAQPTPPAALASPEPPTPRSEDPGTPSTPSAGRRRSSGVPVTPADVPAALPSPPQRGRRSDEGAQADALPSPSHHLSVPLTLLSLNNGGAHSRTPRSARGGDGLALREGSLTGSLGGSDAASPASPSGAGGALQALGAEYPSPSERGRLLGRPNSARSNSGPTSLVLSPIGVEPASAASPGAAQPTGSLWTMPPNLSGAATSSPSGAAAAAGDAAAASASSFAAEPGSPRSAAGSGGSITMPAHLCVHRPPTPLFKEEDLFASLSRHASSPSKRRSRFASSTLDTSLLAAAAAAIAADDAGLLDSPATSSGGAGAAAVGDARFSRRSGVVGVAGSDGSFSLGGPGGGLLGAGMEAAPWSSPSCTSRRAPTQLGTVPEEPQLVPHSRGDAFPSSSSSFGGGSAAGAAGGGRTGAPAAGSGSAVAGRRQRPSAAMGNDLPGGDPDGGSRSPRPPAAPVGSTRAPDTDSLSSFMMKSSSIAPGSPARPLAVGAGVPAR